MRFGAKFWMSDLAHAVCDSVYCNILQVVPSSHLPMVLSDVIVKVRPLRMLQSALFPAVTASKALCIKRLKSLWFIEMLY